MITPVRGLDLAHYMQFAFTPIVRATVTPGEQINPAVRYNHTIHYDVVAEDADPYDFVFGSIPNPIADVLVTVKSRGCYHVNTDGITFQWGTIAPPPKPPWAYAPWWCPVSDDDSACTPDDCSENTVVFTIGYEEWNANFNGTIGSLIGYPFSEGCQGGACSDRYVELTIDFLAAEAVYEDDTIEQDLTYSPHHGWATWHTTIPGGTPGILSRALGDVRVDPDYARMVCYHEWAPSDDEDDKRYAVGGLVGINQRPTVEGELGDLAHGSVLIQRVQGMTVRVWTETDCIII